MSESCEKEKCAHYIGADKLRFNRGRFLWTIIIFSVATTNNMKHLSVIGARIYERETYNNVIESIV